MDRAELHNLIDACLDAMDCDECRDILIEHVGIHLLNTVAMHNANELANKVRDKELTAVQAYDALTGSVLPLYAMAGHKVSAQEEMWARRMVQQFTTRGQN